MSKAINLLDLFAGIGGFFLAMQRAGFEINNHYLSEIDKYAQQIYKKQFSRSIQLGDVTGINGRHGKIDIITGGFPCQSFSIAGNRGGFTDTRGTLFFEIERLARLYRPAYMVLENVKGLFSHDGGNTIRVILDALRGLDYSVQLLLLNTLDFGIPQNRERCFFICTARGKRQPEISHIREAKATYTQFSNCIEIGTLRNYKGENPFRKMSGCYSPALNARAREDGDMQPVIAYTDSGPGRIYQKRKTIPPLRAHDGCSHDNVVCIAENQRSEIREMNISPAIQACSSGRIGQGTPVVCQPVLTPDRVNKRQNGRRIKSNGEPSFTLTAQDKHGTILRRLTSIECERLQDYPDGWTQYGINENGETVEISDTQRYKTLGNSITVKPVELIMRAIKEAMNV